MKASVVPATTVEWKCPGMRRVLWEMMLTCSAPKVTPVMPPMNPKSASDSASAANPGLPHGALASHSNRPFDRPFFRWATSTAAGTVIPCTMLASTARYIAYDVLKTFHAGDSWGSTRRW